MRKLLIVFITACMLFNITAYADYEQEITLVETKTEFLKNHNIINGYDDGNLYLDNYITRAEFCKMIAAATGITSDKYNNGGWLFLDVPENHWANKYVYYCFKYDYIGGVTQNGDIYFVDLDDEKNPVAVTKGETVLPYKTAPVNLFEPDEYITC